MRLREVAAWTWICGVGWLLGSSAFLIPHRHANPHRRALPALDARHKRALAAGPYLAGNATNLPSNITAGPNSTALANSTAPGLLRGVNIGGWLILEEWMNGDVFSGFDAHDQYSFDSQPGAAEALEKHWRTWFTRDDVANLTTTGINALRIPIGYWAYDNDGTPYIKGADAYLEQAIGWARDAGLKVWVDLHGAPGSQNGFDNSGRAGDVDWQQDGNINRTISVLMSMARKYGAQEYADTVVGLELVNEPISWGNNNINTTQQFAQQAYHAVRSAAAGNPNLVVVMHDAFQGLSAWRPVAESLGAGSGFAIDTHLYQNQDPSDLNLTQAQHIAMACGDWASELAQAGTASLPTFVGEWTASTQICVNPDGSTTAGTSCSVEGCQCQTDDVEQWTDGMVEQTRRFVEAQLDTFEAHSQGYFLWAYKGPGAWGFTTGIEKGFIPNPITDRKYPGQCRNSSGSGTQTGQYVAKRAALAIS